MKVLFDTNVWIEFFRNPDGKAAFEARTNRPLCYMSSLVAMELFAGCRTARLQQAMTSFLKPFEKGGRLVTPDHGVYLESARILCEFGLEGVRLDDRRKLVSDVLIAVSAARAGIIVVTANAKDFERIAKHSPNRLDVTLLSYCHGGR